MPLRRRGAHRFPTIDTVGASDIPFPDTPDEFVHTLPDEAPRITAGIDHFGVGAVLEATARAVESPDRDRASLALAFLRDGILLTRHRGLDTEYRQSGLLELLRLKLYAPEYAIRGWAIYTLGKLGPRENARHLRAALPWYVDHDPLRLDALIFELGWLAGRRRIDHRQLLTDLATSRAYLTRWATVQILWERQMSSGRLEWGARRSPGWAIQLLRRLAQDSHPAVRHDARGAVAERRRRKLLGRWSTPEGRQAIVGPEPGDSSFGSSRSLSRSATTCTALASPTTTSTWSKPWRDTPTCTRSARGTTLRSTGRHWSRRARHHGRGDTRDWPRVARAQRCERLRCHMGGAKFTPGGRGWVGGASTYVPLVASDHGHRGGDPLPPKM